MMIVTLGCWALQSVKRPGRGESAGCHGLVPAAFSFYLLPFTFHRS